MLVRTIQRLLSEAQRQVPDCECVALVDVESGLLFGMTDNAFSAELRELMAATAAHWLSHSLSHQLDRAMDRADPSSRVQSFATVSGSTTHIVVRCAAHPERAVAFVVRSDADLHEKVERARYVATLFDHVF
ncbi:MAG: hypothetical protein U0269_28495 [Polyangiales bacterium]